MEPKTYYRDTAFLYPNLDCKNIDPDEQIRTLELITRITTIVNTANHQLLELVDGGAFSYVNCVPKVRMECVSDIASRLTSSDYNNVRICVASFDGYDYTENYKTLVEEYKTGAVEISHLVALQITSNQKKVQFSADKDKKFDVIIKASLDHLETILVSIMLDISLYHYFGLSENLHDRKTFNKIKFSYLSNKYSKAEQEEYFGLPLPDNTIYLPFTMDDVKKINRRSRDDSRQKAIEEMLEAFATFLASSSLALEVKTDRDGDILAPYDHIPQNLFDAIQKITRENKECHNYTIVLLKDSTGKTNSLVLQYNQNGNVPCWVSKELEELDLLRIVAVRQGR